MKAVSDAREPESASEVRSFFGLVNFCARFIPDLATTDDPLRKLTRQNETFQWGPEQNKPSNRLKKNYQKLKPLLTLTRMRRPKL